MAVEVVPPAASASQPTEESFPQVDPVTGDRDASTRPADLASLPAPDLSPQDDVDFLLHPAELAKGRRAAENHLSSFRSEESRRSAEEALETLATVISGGKCDSVEFPWQQVRPYHGAAALTILKEKGAPARIEALRCRRDTTRGYRIVPESYPARQVQKIRSTLTKVIAECSELGFVSKLERDAALAETGGRAERATPHKTVPAARGKKKAASLRSRTLGDGELRALMAAAVANGGTSGCRDAVFFALAYRGLKIAEITALKTDSVKFSNKTGVCSIVARPARSGGRGRRVELKNEELICLEDWLDHRGDARGPLLCTLGRNGKIEGKRLTMQILKEICDARAHEAKVDPFTPNDLSRSAEALVDHRKAARRRATRAAQETLSTAEKALYLPAAEVDRDETSETIQFPFLGFSD